MLFLMIGCGTFGDRGDSISFGVSMKRHAWIGLGLSASGDMEEGYAVIGASPTGACVRARGVGRVVEVRNNVITYSMLTTW